MGRWREIPAQKEIKKSPFLEAFGGNTEQHLEEQERKALESKEVEESLRERKEQEEVQETEGRSEVSAETKKPRESRIKGDKGHQGSRSKGVGEKGHLPGTQKSGLTKKNGQPPDPRPKGVLPQGAVENGFLTR